MIKPNMMEMELIYAGKFTMGSPETEPDRQDDETLHEVTLTNDFYMGLYPVTGEQYLAKEVLD
ncbi:MAG: SUMF1/EgtB/PvdO family nonheme iron enzyme [Treponema sp.]|nr:SUMF1/EgtB/PvdO family nonheme iron enzyme [Treponema sp.]